MDAILDALNKVAGIISGIAGLLVIIDWFSRGGGKHSK